MFNHRNRKRSQKTMPAETVVFPPTGHALIQESAREATKAVNQATVVDNGSCYCSVVRWLHLSFTKGNIMFSTLAVLAILAIPFLLELYFNMPRGSEAVEEEYIPDGR